MLSKMAKNVRKCATCQYFSGCSTKVYSPNLVECDLNERATCNLTGQTKAAWHSCNKHEKKHNI